ncbi:ComEA family DNA-binding protein [Clostridium merdae]|uniref:ComEA family DNA-binding protein n=1 Tax=Clostridium merdae TaxID=1958780 RepID=UPI000A2689E8|nr:helix-hairpin-helix domain-containing protein [Clostridium merdae]
MDNDARQVRWLLAIAVFLCALIIGYNVLFVPQVTLTTVVRTDTSSAVQAKASANVKQTESSQQEAYEPESVEKTALVNLNTADAGQLETLPGVGPVTAKRIIAYRDSVGAFRTKEELMQVDGIGEKTFEKLQNFIIVEDESSEAVASADSMP